MISKAIIFGLSGYTLTSKEKALFKKFRPWGVILFSRNIKNILQVKKLTKSIKILFCDKNFPILIDEEGGSVSRLIKIINLRHFSQKYFANFYKKDKKNFYKEYDKYIFNLSNILKILGININTVPVLDVYRKKSHKIIGSRSFSSDPKIVTDLGNLCINLYKKNKIATVIKHIPGHGSSNRDSHFKTPTIHSKKSKLINVDFKPFKLCKSFFAMTAHIIYSVYDPNNTATHSKIIIDKVIRKQINYKGILISDDISMKSLKYNLENNATRAIHAGCNLVLH